MKRRAAFPHSLRCLSVYLVPHAGHLSGTDSRTYLRLLSPCSSYRPGLSVSMCPGLSPHRGAGGLVEERSRPLHPTLTLLPCGPMWRLTADRNLLFISEKTQQTNGIRSQSGGGHCPRSLGQGGWDPKPVCVCGFVPWTRSGSAFLPAVEREEQVNAGCVFLFPG